MHHLFRTIRTIRTPRPTSRRTTRSTRLSRLIAVPAAMLGVGALVLGAGAVTATAAARPALAVGGGSYYVNCAAKTNGNGSAASPWNRTKFVNAHGAYAPGDHILFKRGTSCSGRLIPTGSGAAGSPIVIGAYGSGAKPTINGGGTPNNTGTIRLLNQHDWTVQDLHLTNKVTTKTTKTYRAGLLFLNEGGKRLANLTAQRLTVDDVVSSPVAGFHGPRLFGGIAALTFGKKGDGFDHLQILHNAVSKVGRTGIVVNNAEYPASSDTDVRVGYDTVRSARGDSIILIGVNGGRIDHSLSANGADFWPCPQCKKVSPETANSGIWTARSQNVLIDHNEIYGEHRKGGDGEGIDIDVSAKNTTIEANYVHDNQGGGILICNATDLTIRYNILENNTRAAIVFTTKKASKNVHLYNNTIYVAGSVAADSVVRTKQGFGAKGTQFFNNIVYSYGNSSYRFPGPLFSKANTFIGHHSKTEPKGAGTSHAYPGLRNPGHGGNGMKTVSGYRLQTTKGAQRGVAVPASVKTDFFGKKVNPKSPFRGASGG